jgi:hypothetical protein
MSDRKSTPGVSRQQRISNEGLLRLEKQLTSGAAISNMVLAQWIKRYGSDAVEIIKEHGRYSAELERLSSS